MKHFVLAGLIAFPQSAFPCTGIRIGSTFMVTVGQNIGWFWPLDAALVVNKRGMKKSGLTASATDTPAQWTSKYGSMTLNPVGREFPLGGVNEKGLTVQGLHSYDGRYEISSGLPTMQMFQWIQYQLDISSTIEEAIANALKVRPYDNAQLTLHFMICESSGRCATFEWLHGKPMEVRYEKMMPVPVFTNSDYASSVDAYQKCATDSCPLPEDAPNFSLKRFVQAARGTAAYDNSQNPYMYMFKLLDTVKQPFPLASWSVVIRNAHADTDPNSVLTLSVSAPGAKEIQYADLRKFDLSCKTPAQMMLLDLKQFDDVRKKFRDYDIELQKRLASGSRAPENLQKILVNYPDSTTCVNP